MVTSDQEYGDEGGGVTVEPPTPDVVPSAPPESQVNVVNNTVNTQPPPSSQPVVAVEHAQNGQNGQNGQNIRNVQRVEMAQSGQTQNGQAQITQNGQTNAGITADGTRIVYVEKPVEKIVYVERGAVPTDTGHHDQNEETETLVRKKKTLYTDTEPGIPENDGSHCCCLVM